MSGNIATIGFAAQTAGLKTAKTDLEALGPASDKAEKGAKKVEKAVLNAAEAAAQGAQANDNLADSMASGVGNAGSLADAIDAAAGSSEALAGAADAAASGLANQTSAAGEAANGLADEKAAADEAAAANDNLSDSVGKAVTNMGLYVDAQGKLRNSQKMWASNSEKAEAVTLALAGALDEQSVAALRAVGALNEHSVAALKTAESIAGIVGPVDAMAAPFNNTQDAYRRLEEAMSNGIISRGEFSSKVGELQNVFMQAGGSMEQWNNIAGKTEAQGNRLVAMYGLLRNAIAGYAGYLATSALTQYADTWSDLTSRLSLAVGGHEAGAVVMERLQDVARRTYSSLETSTEAFISNVRVLDQLGYSTNQALDYTEALNLALVVSGAKAERAASVQDALSKAMASGKLAGDDLNRVIEYGGEVAELIAAELGVGTLQLREMGRQGKITGDVLYSALSSALTELQEKAEEMPTTMGDAFLQVRNSVMAYVGSVDQSLGITATLAEYIIFASGHISTLANVAAIAGAALAVAFAPALLSGMASGLVMVGTAGVAALRAITAAALANPFTAIATAITALIATVWLFRDEIKQAWGIDIVETVITVGNEIVGTFVGAYDSAVAVWQSLPAALGDAVYSTANTVVNGVEAMINKAIELFNDYLANVRSAISTLSFGRLEGPADLDKVEFGGLENPYEGAISDAATAANKAMQNARGRDYIGAPVRSAANGNSQDVGRLEEINRLLNERGERANVAAESDEKAAKAAEKAAKEGEKLAEAYEKIVQGATQKIESMRLEQEALGMTEEAANALRYEQELLNQAINAGISLTPQQTAQLKGLAVEMASVEAETKRMKESLDFAKDATRGALGEMFNGLKQGKSIWESFGSAVMGILDNIVDKLLNDVVSALFETNASAGSGGGGLGGLISKGVSWLFSAKGNSFDRSGHIEPFAKGGAFTNSVVTNPTMFAFAKGGALGVMGEAGPEAIMPLKRGADGSLGVQLHDMAKQSSSEASNVTFAPTININAPQANAQEVADLVDKKLKDFNKQLQKNFGRNAAVNRLMNRPGN